VTCGPILLPTTLPGIGDVFRSSHLFFFELVNYVLLPNPNRCTRVWDPIWVIVLLAFFFLPPSLRSVRSLLPCTYALVIILPFLLTRPALILSRSLPSEIPPAAEVCPELPFLSCSPYFPVQPSTETFTLRGQDVGRLSCTGCKIPVALFGPSIHVLCFFDLLSFSIRITLHSGNRLYRNLHLCTSSYADRSSPTHWFFPLFFSRIDGAVVLISPEMTVFSLRPLVLWVCGEWRFKPGSPILSFLGF